MDVYMIYLVKKHLRSPGCRRTDALLPYTPFFRSIFDRLSDALFTVAPVLPDSARDHDALNAAARDRIEAAQHRLAATDLPPPARTEATTLDLAPQLAPGRYAEMVAAAQDYIVAGDIFQVEIGRAHV